MIDIKRFTVNMLQENCYVVSDETRECVIIDCGAYYEEEKQAIVQYIDSNRLKPIHLLVTHGHLDHNFGNEFIMKTYGLQPELSERDEKLMLHAKGQAAQYYDMELDMEMPPPARLLEENEVVTFGSHRLKVLQTPGHSKGCICFYCEEEHLLFSGDTLFHNTIGRTDLTGGSMMMIIQSLRFLAQLPDNVVVYPGHGETTTIGDEVAHNPYMDR